MRFYTLTFLICLIGCAGKTATPNQSYINERAQFEEFLLHKQIEELEKIISHGETYLEMGDLSMAQTYLEIANRYKKVLPTHLEVRRENLEQQLKQADQ